MKAKCNSHKKERVSPLKVRLPLDPTQEPKPYFGRRLPGSVLRSKGNPELIALAMPKGYRGQAEGCIPVLNTKMAPTYTKGMFIPIKRVIHQHLLNWGYKYVYINKALNPVLCRFFPSPLHGRIVLKFNNKRCRDRYIEQRNIKGLFTVEEE